MSTHAHVCRVLASTTSVILLLACRSDDAPFAVTRPAPSPSPPSATPTTLSPRDTQLLGSWELVFDRVEPINRAKTETAASRAAIGNRARLDIHPTASNTVAVALTPRWNRRHKFTSVTIEENELVVGERDGGPPVMFEIAAEERNRWNEIRLARAPDGSPAGAFIATGTVDTPNAARYDVRGLGRVRTDDLAPEIRVAPVRRGRGGKYLPWEWINIELSEPLPKDPLLPQIAPAFPELGLTSYADEVERDTTGWYGVSQVFHTERATIAIAPSARDPSGNAFLPYRGSLPVHALGEVRAMHDFGPGDEPAMWGGAARVDDAASCAGASGGCIVFPPERQRECALGAGAAGFITTKDGTIKKVKAKVRFRVSDAENATTAPEVFYPIALDIGQPGSTWGPAIASPPFALTRTSAMADLPWQSPWTILEVEVLEAPRDALGYVFQRPICDYFTIPPRTEVQDTRISIVVDEVWGE